jgi:hypothetical protein
VAEILSRYGLMLITSGGGPGVCQGFPTAPSAGTLSRTGAVQYKPSGSGLAAAAARSVGPTSAETIQYTGAAGTYRYRVVSGSGSGAYAMSFTRY